MTRADASPADATSPAASAGDPTSAEPATRAIDERMAASLVPTRDRDGHKGTFGRLSIVAGSLDYAGAALMSGAAAMRAGAGLVTLFVPTSVQPALAGRVPELITRGLPESGPGTLDGRASADRISEEPHDALVVGPGLPASRVTTDLVTRLLRLEGPPAIVDAGALHALASVPGWWRRLGRACVLTPHPGELRRLGPEPGTTDGERRAAAKEAAARWEQVVVLKGAGTLVARPDGDLAEAPFRLPALATAGTGDVLAGIIGSLCAQGLDPADAAVLGVYLHGRAGEHLSERLGDAGMLATDLLPEIPRVRRHLAEVGARERHVRLGFGSPARP